jgi:vacuolar iron transporter family protein
MPGHLFDIAVAPSLQVARQLTAKDAIRAHARDELGIDIDSFANPLQAAVSSGISFVSGSLVPTLLILVPLPSTARLWCIVVAVCVCLAIAGGISARLGGAPLWRGSLRMLVGGMMAMAATFAVGRAFGTEPA